MSGHVKNSISETQCHRLNASVWLTTMVACLCYTTHLGVQFDLRVWRDSAFVVFCFTFLDCCNTFSECRPATHRIYVLCRHLWQRGTELFGPIQNAGRPSLWNSWWWFNIGSLADIWVAVCICRSQSGYGSRCVDMAVIKLLLKDLSRFMSVVCGIYQLLLHVLRPTLGGVNSPTHLVTVILLCQLICERTQHRLKWGEFEEAKC
jgi:hypothetical protein